MEIRRFFLFIAFGLLAMFAGEFQNNALVHGRPDYFLMAIGLYAIIAAISYGIAKALDRYRKPDLLGYFIVGILGLVIIEWLILGNIPGTPALQAGMFAWWAAMFMIPRVFTAEEARPVRRRVMIALLSYSIISTLVVLALTGKAPEIMLGGITGLMLAFGFIILNFQFLPYFERNGKRPWLRAFLWLLVIGAIAQFLTW